MSKIKEMVTGEIEALHAFISAWFRGETENEPEVFKSGFRARLSENFTNIQPSGMILSLADLTEPILNAHAANPDFFIQITDVDIRYSSANEDLILATYVELQKGAKNTTPSDNARRSSVWFKRNEDRLIWLHIHETTVPWKADCDD